MAIAGRTGHPANQPADSAMLSGLANRDESALVALIETHGKSVYRRALQVLHCPLLAEEVAQDTMLVLWWCPESFDASKGNIRSFLMGVARFKAIDLVRREEVARSKVDRLLDRDAFFEGISTVDDPEDVRFVRNVVSQLPVRKREVIYLAFYEGLTYRQVAEELGLPLGTVKTRIRDSLIRLRSEISAQNLA